MVLTLKAEVKIAPQTISTKDVYQSKHMARAGANIDTTYYYDQQWIIISTHAKPLKSTSIKNYISLVNIE